MNPVRFCRRFSTHKLLGLNVLSSKCVHYQYYGSSKHAGNYTKHLFKKTVEPISQCQFVVANNFISGFRTSKRYKQMSSDKNVDTEDPSKNTEEPPEKLSLFKRYHKMLKEYWYVLLPVHGVTSVLWFGGFYYAAKSGIDIVPFLEFINLPEKFIAPLRNSSLGHIAVASAFYKLATPARYMVTLGGTTFSIKFLTKRGLIKPAPTKEQIKSIIQNKLKKETNENKP